MPTTPSQPALRLSADQFFPLFSDPARYHILAHMLDGLPHYATELGGVIGRSRMSANKHLALLRNVGLIEPCIHPRDRRNKSFRLRPALVPPAKGPRAIDFGCCVVRFAEEPAPEPAAPAKAPPAPAPAPLVSRAGDF